MTVPLSTALSMKVATLYRISYKSIAVTISDYLHIARKIMKSHVHEMHLNKKPFRIAIHKEDCMLKHKLMLRF